METIKGLLSTYGRPLLSKWITRGLLYGGAAISFKLNIDAPPADAWTKVVDWIVTAVLVGLGLLIDYWHQKADRKAANVPSH